MGSHRVFSETTQCRNQTTGMPKRTFPSKSDAKRAAKRNSTYLPGMGILQPYKCHHCGWFHLGHPLAKDLPQSFNE